MTLDAEGYIKFNCQLTRDDFEFPVDEYASLEAWRKRLYELNLIGAYPNGIGFGNISIRYGLTSGFIISGSATGNLSHLEKEHYALVDQYNLKENSLYCIGRIRASSESLSHAIIYEKGEKINAVIHIHHKALWDQLKDKIPTTSKKVEYGTPAMAEEISRKMILHRMKKKGMIIMGGHEEGIITFGETLDLAGNLILKYFAPGK